MAHASPSAKRNIGSPKQPNSDQRYLSDFLSDDRNSESSHRDALEQARLEHERVRLNALRISELHELSEQRKQLAEEQKKEENRLKAEAAVRQEQERLRKLQAEKVPELPPQPDPPKPTPKESPAPSAPSALTTQITQKDAQTNGLTASNTTAKQTATAPAQSSTQQPGLTAAQNAPTNATPSLFKQQQPSQSSSPSLFGAPKANGVAPTSQASQQQPGAQPAPASSPFSRQAAAPTQTPTPASAPTTTTPAPAAPPTDRYIQIHQELKKLRKDVDKQMKTPGSHLKPKLGEMRRTVRKAVGQLTSGKGANNKPVSDITAALRQSLDGTLPSDPVDPSLFVKEKREPVDGATHNGDQLPSVFIFLVNHVAKAVIRQFASEVGANGHASAEPIGIVVAQIFSNPDFHWRGKTMIDVLICKFRVACPVLFGARGSEKTEAGRKALGWRKEDGHWLTEQAHNDRMAGLGSGYASVTLRDFSKASKKNPYPPSNFWMAVANIINTPKEQVSETQFIVLKALIQGHEVRFINFYGNAGIAALRMALVDFPKKAPANSSNAQKLQVYGQVLQSEKGVALV